LRSKKELKPSALIYPTPVVLVTSVDEGGRPNICTLAAVGILCGKPPHIGISIRPSRFSHGLISKTKEFVVNIPTTRIVKETDYCGVTSGRAVDKFKEAKLTQMRARKVRPPIIKECPVNLECKLKDIVRLGSHDLFIGEVVNVDVDESVVASSGKIDYEKLNPITWNPITEEYHSLGKVLGSEGFQKRR